MRISGVSGSDSLVDAGPDSSKELSQDVIKLGDDVRLEHRILSRLSHLFQIVGHPDLAIHEPMKDRPTDSQPRGRRDSVGSQDRLLDAESARSRTVMPYDDGLDG